MIVVADTSPLNYLILIDEAGLLPDLFGRVLIPEAVASELQHARTPIKVRDWMTKPPIWLELYPAPKTNHTQLTELDPGEREAIELAIHLGIKLILMDEFAGRHQAIKLQLKVRGTLGILEQAARLGKVDLPLSLKKLEGTNFRLSPALRDAALRRLNP
jgi:predicted nucleic acid-binding protein